MTAANIVILSSSPPRPFRSYALDSALSSPLNLPSPTAIVRKRPLLKAGGRAAPIPDNATATFITAASLLKSCGSLESIQSVGGSESVNIEEVTIEVPKTKTVRKPRTLKNSSEADTTTKKPRKTLATKIDAGSMAGGGEEKPARKPRATKAKAVDVREEPEEQPARKPRAKKDNAKIQTTISKARVTKAASGPKQKKTAVSKTTDTVSSHFDSVSKDNTNSSQNALDGSLQLTEAIKRRTDWTPPRATNLAVQIEEPSIGGDDIELAATVDTQDANDHQISFTNLVTSFGFDKGEGGGSISANNAINSTNSLKRRKLIEMVKSNMARPSPQLVSKVKAVKKKPRTLTELATSAYLPINEAEETTAPAPAPAPLLQYFSLDGAATKPSPDSGFKVPTKPRSRSPTKRQSKKDQLNSLPTLLSPQSAMKQVNKQDFVFGTSSQLAREESPTLLRDLQRAMQASNQDDDDPFGYITAASRLSVSSTQISAASDFATKGSLWTAAARDSSGALMDVEVVDLSETPIIEKFKQAPTGTPITRPSTLPDISQMVAESQDEWHQLDESDTPATRNKVTATSGGVVGPVEAAIRSELLNSPSSSRGCAPKPKSPVKRKRQAKKPLMEKPNFEAYTTAQLSKEIASYHFKPVKNRNQMITLLEKCWEGKQRIALGDVGANSVLQHSPSKSQNTVAVLSAAPAKRPRGQPRKEQTSSTLPNKQSAEGLLSDTDTPLAISRTPKKQIKTLIAEEISDSDSPVTPSPPRRRAAKVGTPPQPLQLSVSKDADAANALSLASEQMELHMYITRAVTTAPRSKDPQQPSWYEKMLMYDPIVLEDLATWLNTGGLQRVGWDGEVFPAQLKKWCNEKSICCLWRENLRGGSRSRY